MSRTRISVGARDGVPSRGIEIFLEEKQASLINLIRVQNAIRYEYSLLKQTETKSTATNWPK